MLNRLTCTNQKGGRNEQEKAPCYLFLVIIGEGEVLAGGPGFYGGVRSAVHHQTGKARAFGPLEFTRIALHLSSGKQSHFFHTFNSN